MSSAAIQLLQSHPRTPIKEYRVNNGRVEARVLDFSFEHEEPQRKAAWIEVSPADLSRHVRDNTYVARWLEQNLGWRQLLRACVGLEPTESFEVPQTVHVFFERQSVSQTRFAADSDCPERKQ